jgi:short-subunit dehydrogenase
MNKATECETVVITGASGGVGRATVRQFAKRGANLALIARGQAGLEAAKREAEASGARALVLPLDVADADAVERAAATVEEQLGPIHIWINNAMTTVFGRFLDIAPEEYRRVTEVTYLGYVHGTRAALDRMVKRNSGTIVQVGSSVAYRGIPLQTAYSGAKHAIQGFTESLREELIHDGSRVHITMVQLPAVNTPQFTWCKNKMDKRWQPIPPIYQPEVIARGIEWAAHHRQRELLIGGTTYKAIWADKLVPGFVDTYLGKRGYSSQLVDGKPKEERPDNLWAPVDKDMGAHGEFDEGSRRGSYQVWVRTHPAVSLGVAALAAVSGLVLRSRRR